MMNKLLGICLLGGLLFPGSLCAESEVRSSHPVSQAVHEFFQALGQNRITDAYTELMKESEMADDREQLELLHQRTREAIELFGPIRGYDFLGVDRVGNHLLRTNYLSLGERFPLRWRFYFYRVRDEQWRLIDIRVDDGIVEMFDERPSESSREPLR